MTRRAAAIALLAWTLLVPAAPAQTVPPRTAKAAPAQAQPTPERENPTMSAAPAGTNAASRIAKGLFTVKSAQKDETLTKIIRLRSRLKNLKLDWDPVTQGMVLRGFTAELGGGTIAAKGRIDWFKPSGPQSMRLEMQGVDFRAALIALSTQMDGKITGKLSGVIDISWTGLKLIEIKRTATGTVNLVLSAGTAERMTILNRIADLSGIEALRAVAFSRGEMVAPVKAGRITVEKLVIEAAASEFSGQGWCQLDTEQMRADFHVGVTPELAAASVRPEMRGGGKAGTSGGGAARRGLVRLPVTASFAGTLDKPEILGAP